jgi:hypothetical protein
LLSKVEACATSRRMSLPETGFAMIPTLPLAAIAIPLPLIRASHGQ